MTLPSSNTGTGENNEMPFSLSLNGHSVVAVTAADTIKEVAVPVGATECVFSSAEDFYANDQTILTVNPIVEDTSGNAPRLNPASFNTLEGISTIYLRSISIAYVNIIFYG